MTAFFPAITVPVRWMSSSEPRGVHGTTQWFKSPRESRPAFKTVRPSTSLLTSIASVHFSASKQKGDIKSILSHLQDKRKKFKVIMCGRVWK